MGMRDFRLHDFPDCELHRGELTADDAADILPDPTTPDGDYIENHQRWTVARVYVMVGCTTWQTGAALTFRAWLKPRGQQAIYGRYGEPLPFGGVSNPRVLTGYTQETLYECFDVPVNGDDLFIEWESYQNITDPNVSIWVCWRGHQVA